MNSLPANNNWIQKMFNLMLCSVVIKIGFTVQTKYINSVVTEFTKQFSDLKTSLTR